MNDDTVKTFVFTSTLIDISGRAEISSWEYHGTELGAKKEFQDILARAWSPFVTYNYTEKKENG